MMKKIYLSLALWMFLSSTVFAAEILQMDADGVKKYVQTLNETIRKSNPYSSPESLYILEGCLAQKKGEEFENKEAHVITFYYSELFKRNTKQVTRVHIDFKKPVSAAVAQNYAADFVEFLRGKNNTQEQKMEVEQDPCKPKNGGIEKRFTQDYFIEFYYAPDRKLIQEVRLWNGNYNN
ncbi:MAG: hypothetical protein JNK65_09410 [Deltaproteobacteria bacterium]|nr:hypothetical protein [Deltaproteobacteria bacterium]